MINTLIFFISAAAHEYWVSLSIGKVKLWIFFSFVMQYAYIIGEQVFLKTFKLEHSNYGNYTFWINFVVLGQPILAIIYYLSVVE